jgi:hypothetical protein
VQAEEIRAKIKKVIGEQIKFEGHFNLVVNNMNEKMQLNLLEWIKRCDNREIDSNTAPAFKGLVAFFFKPRVTNIRGILTKEKNSYFIALFLDKHKYYDLERRRLGFR